MCRSCWILAGLLLALSTTSPAQTTDPRPPEAARVEQLLDLLGSPQFAVREDATRALDALGSRALEGLRHAAASPDPEVARRAEELVQRITKRVESARLLTPRRLHLVYDHTPLAEAVDDLGRKTGFSITLDGDRSRLADRRLTLDTGDATVWQTLDQFCRAAGLVEQSAQPAGVPNGPSAVRDRQRALLAAQAGYGPGQVPAYRLVLAPGKPAETPTCHAGPVRVRALANHPLLPGTAKTAGETLLVLDVAVEPHVAWQGVVDVHVEKAVDDRGQELTQPMGPAADGSDATARVLIESETLPSGGQAAFPVRLKLAEQPPKLLRELRGTVALQVQTPPEPLVTVEHVLSSSGQTVRGADGSSLKVIQATQRENGLVRIHVQLGSLTPALVRRVAGRVINGAARPVAVEWVASSADRANWALFDDKGGTFRLLTLEGPNLANGNGSAAEFGLIFQPQLAQGEPAKLVYTGRRTVVLDVPFVLHDVPLP